MRPIRADGRRNSASSGMVEAWDSDVPEGKVTDFRKAVDAKPDEKVVFSWFEYPSKAGARRRQREVHERPAHGGHGREHAVRRQAHDHGRLRRDRRGRLGAAAAIPTASSCRCPKAKRDAYRELAVEDGQGVPPAWRDAGRSRRSPTTSQHGKVTDFYRAVKAEDGEDVVFSFIEWPDKATRDEAWKKIMADESLKPEGDMPFDGKRMFWGGFEKILDTAESSRALRRHAVNA